jgi:hypothetical protein
MDTRFKHFTAAVLPFDILVKKDKTTLEKIKSYIKGDAEKEVKTENDPFDMQFHFELVENAAGIDDFKKKLGLISESNSGIKTDEMYHSHISKMLNSANLLSHKSQENIQINSNKKEDFTFLKVYKIKGKHVFENKEFRIQDEWAAKICFTYVVLNEYAQLGYVVFGFDIEGDEGVTIKDVSDLEFFRYYTNDKLTKKKSKYQIKRLTKSENNDMVETLLTLQDIMSTDAFKTVWPYMKMRYQRPMLLHLSNSAKTLDGSEFKYAELNQLMYHSVRLPAETVRDIKIDTEDKKYVVTCGSGVSVCALNEGAFVIDRSPSMSGYKAQFNKYFLAYILALNQREVMIQINQLSSQLTWNQLKNSKNETIRYLNQLKSRIELFKFKQLFYSVAVLDELVVFYREMQSAMNIEVLLEDNKECVQEVVTRLEEIAQDKRDLWINATLSGIGCLGVFSFLKDLIPFAAEKLPTDKLDISLLHTDNFEKYYKMFSSLFPLFIFMVLLLLMRKKIK